jgi:hypothetical protein
MLTLAKGWSLRLLPPSPPSTRMHTHADIHYRCISSVCVCVCVHAVHSLVGLWRPPSEREREREREREECKECERVRV